MYDDRSGDTHILGNFAGQILEHLMLTSASIDELARALPGPGSRLEDGEAGSASGLADVLEHLRHKGIVKSGCK